MTRSSRAALALALAALLGCFSATMTHAAPDSRVREVIDRVTAAYGGRKALDRVRAYRVEGSVFSTMRHSDAPTIRVFARPAQLKVLIDYPGRADELAILDRMAGLDATTDLPAVLSAAELEMMNLTGDGTGLDMVTMPQAMREQVPTANFFQRGGYERNPVASRHNTVARLIAITNERMDVNSAKPGAQELASAF